MATLLSLNAYHYKRGGADIAYFNHAELFERRGWNTLYYSMNHDLNDPASESEYFAEEINYDKQSAFLVKALHASRVVYSFEAKKKMAKMLDSHAVDIAHVHSVYHHQSPSVLVELKRRSIPVVLTAHDLKLTCPAYRMLDGRGKICEACKGGRVWNVAIRRCIKGSVSASSLIAVEAFVHNALGLYSRNVSRIIVPSHFYFDKFVEWGWPADKLRYVPNFVDIPETMPAAQAGNYILYFGRLAPEKGLTTLIRAAALARVNVKIAGSGPSAPSLQALVEELDAPVHFLGRLNGAELEAVIDGSRAMVLPSEWNENAPLSVLEGYARGKTLIGADIGGIPEMIIEGETGWKYESGDYFALAERLAFVNDLSGVRLAEMGSGSHRFAQSRFGEMQYFLKVNEIYKELGVSGPGAI